jgi:hypothetical protein
MSVRSAAFLPGLTGAGGDLGGKDKWCLLGCQFAFRLGGLLFRFNGWRLLFDSCFHSRASFKGMDIGDTSVPGLKSLSISADRKPQYMAISTGKKFVLQDASYLLHMVTL